MAETIETRILLQPEHAGRRLDQILAELFPEHSRARLQQWTREGLITVDGARVKPSHRCHGAEQLDVQVTIRSEQGPMAQPIELDVLHEDAAVIVLNKPAGLVVHPAAGNPDGTLQNGLLHRYPELESVPRSGIVHRLDRLTSGVMVVARSLTAHTALVRQLQDRSVSRRYRALCHGALVSGGTVDQPIGRHPKDRKRMAVVADGKPAVTHYRLHRRFRDFTDLDVYLETGRTHQIRVHMAHVRHALVGDPVYGVGHRPPAGAGAELLEVLRTFRRQALHAAQLRFIHPDSVEEVSFEAPLPEDHLRLLQGLADEPSQQP